MSGAGLRLDASAGNSFAFLLRPFSRSESAGALKDWFDGSFCFFGCSGGARVFPVRARTVLAGRKAPAAQERNALGISGDFFRTNRDATGDAAQEAA
jgi:hypothetical protein